MAHISRLIVLLLVLLAPARSWAILTVPSGSAQQYRCQNPSNSVWYYGNGSLSAACSVMAASAGTDVTSGGYRKVKTWEVQSCTASSCTMKVTEVATCVPAGGCGFPGTTYSYPVVVGNLVGTVVTCPSDSTAVGSVCQCNSGFRPDGAGAACVPYSCPAGGSYSAVTQPDQLVPNAGDNQCDGGCEFKPSSWKAGADGKIWATWPFVSTGKVCGGAKMPTDPKYETGDLNNKNPAPVACPANQCPGNYNGANICVACSGTKVDGPSTAASGTTPTNDTSGTIKGEQKSTDCTGTSCTTTTTYKDANGNTVGTKTETKDQKSFCQENPTLSICKESAFGGACAGGFTCNGDGVQCALAKEVHKRNCEWYGDVDQARKQRGLDAMSAGIQPDGHPAKSPDSAGMDFGSRIDQTDRLGGGCPVDVTVAGPMGMSFTLPFSSMCDKLQTIGRVMVGICMLAAAVIVFKQ